MQEYQPTILMLVPLIIENVYSKIMKQASTNPVKRAAFRCMLWTSGGPVSYTHLAPELRENLSAAAHLIHGSSDGRFRITYCTKHLSAEEVELSLIHI